MHHRRWIRVVVLGAGMLLVACGGGRAVERTAGQHRSTEQGRVVEVRMVDTAFEPAGLTVSSGETVTFRFTNEGKAVHEAFIGDAQDQASHQEQMASQMEHGGHGGHGEDADRALTLDPGESGELTYTFAEQATLKIGCHQPGHYAAGMRASVEVT